MSHRSDDKISLNRTIYLGFIKVIGFLLSFFFRKKFHLNYNANAMPMLWPLGIPVSDLLEGLV